jgi:hypothetical protein
VIVQRWCAACRLRTDVMGAMRKGLAFTDPLRDLSLRGRAAMNTDEYYELLDKLWGAGRLPQRFVIPPGPARYWSRVPRDPPPA